MQIGISGKGKRIGAVVLAAMMAMSPVNSVYMVGNVEAAENVNDNGSVVYAKVNSVDEFRDYIDSDGLAASEDIIDTAWSGKTDVHKIVLEEDGTLLVAMLDTEDDVKLQLYSNFALTSQVDTDEYSIRSSRGDISIFNVEAGTYYYRGNRWNGYIKGLNVTTYIGFIPGNGDNVDTTNNQYDTSDDGIEKVSNIPTVVDSDNLRKYINNDGAFASQSSTKNRGDAVRKLELQEDGWLLVYPLGTADGNDKGDWSRWALYTNKDMTSRCLYGNTMENTNEDAYKIYLKAGTYYYDTWKWNGSSSMTVTTYLGFLPASYRIRMESNDVSSDKSSAVVKFGVDQDYMDGGLIRVEEGYIHPVDIQDDDVWKVDTRENAIEGDTAVIHKNGVYTARISNKEYDDAYCMVTFTVSGIDNSTVNSNASSNKDNTANKGKVNTPKIKQVKRSSRIIKGTADKMVKVVVQTGGKIYNTKSSSTGTWKVKVSKKLKKGNKVKVWAINSASKKSKVSVYKVK